jgi:hypothetical protein
LDLEVPHYHSCHILGSHTQWGKRPHRVNTRRYRAL